MRGFILATIISLQLIACGSVNRKNPNDPYNSNIAGLANSLIGTWSRDDADGNQVYTFKTDGSVLLRDYTGNDGSIVDRNAIFPTTLVYSFSGTYQLDGSLLHINFATVYSNNPDAQIPTLRSKTVNVRIADDKLTVIDQIDGEKIFRRGL
jgi:hypothetical protein